MSNTKALTPLPPRTMLECVQDMLKGHIKPNQANSKLLVRLLALDDLKTQVSSLNDQVSETLVWIDKELVLLRNPYNRAHNKDPRQLTLFDCGMILDELGKDRKVKDDPLGLINKRDVLKVLKQWIIENYGNDTGDPG